jgi:restriction system protein
LSAALALAVVFTVFIFLALAASFLFRRSPARQLRVATLAQLKALSPRGFEQAIATLLGDLGYKDVRVVGGAGDLARDVAATNPNGVPVAVQCKHYTSSVTSPQVQLFIGMLKTQYQGSKGIYATTSRYTAPARNLGLRFGVELWDGASLAKLVSEARLMKERSKLSPEELRQRSLALWHRNTKGLLVVLLFTAFIPSLIFWTAASTSYASLEWFWGVIQVQPCCNSLSVLAYGPVGRSKTGLFCIAFVISVALYLRPPERTPAFWVSEAIFLILALLAFYEIIYPYQFAYAIYVPVEEFLVFLSGLVLLRAVRQRRSS